MRELIAALALAACLAAPPLMAAEHGEHAGHSGTVEGVRATGVVHAIADGTVNLSHDPVPEIGWPAMTMDLPLLEGAGIGAVAPGDAVVIVLEKGPDGFYGVRSLTPAR